MNRYITRTRALAIVGIVIASISGGAYAMGMHNAPCDGPVDCLFTAWWYAFLR